MSGLATLGPYGWVTTVSTAVTPIIGINSNRNGLIFVNTSSTVLAFILPHSSNTTLTAGVGIPLLPQGDYRLLPVSGAPLGFGGAWDAIAVGGTTSILVMEFFGG